MTPLDSWALLAALAILGAWCGWAVARWWHETQEWRSIREWHQTCRALEPYDWEDDE